MNFKEVAENDSRKINRMILKNKGLTKRRKKIDRNARVKNKVKFQKKVQKLKVKYLMIELRKRFEENRLGQLFWRSVCKIGTYKEHKNKLK